MGTRSFSIHAMATRPQGSIEWLGVMAARLLVPFVSFVVTILVARFWGKSALAQYAIIWSWLAISQYFSLFGLPDYLAKEAGRNPQDAARYLKHGLLLVLASGCSAMLFLASWAVCSGYSPELKLCLLIAALSLPASGCTAMCQAICTALRKINLIIISLLAESLLFVAGAVTVFLAGGGLAWLIAVVVAARSLTALWYSLAIRSGALARLPAFDWACGRGILRGAATFGLTSVAGLVFLRIDIVVLSFLCSMAVIGPYSAAARLIEICLVFPLTFYFVNLAPAARFFQISPGTPPRTLEQGASQLFYIVLAVAAGGILFAETVLSFLYGPAYASAGWALRLLLVAFLIMSPEALLSMSCQAAGLHRTAMWIAVGRLCAGLICQWLFVRQWGVAGAPYGTIAALVLSFAATYAVVEKRITHYDWVLILRKPLLVCLLAIGAVLLVPPDSHVAVRIGVFLVSYLLGTGLMEGWWRLLLRREMPATGSALHGHHS